MRRYENSSRRSPTLRQIQQDLVIKYEREVDYITDSQSSETNDIRHLQHEQRDVKKLPRNIGVAGYSLEMLTD